VIEHALENIATDARIFLEKCTRDGRCTRCRKSIAQCADMSRARRAPYCVLTMMRESVARLGTRRFRQRAALWFGAFRVAGRPTQVVAMAGVQ
jgi:hypothetical protein